MIFQVSLEKTFKVEFCRVVNHLSQLNHIRKKFIATAGISQNVIKKKKKFQFDESRKNRS